MRKIVLAVMAPILMNKNMFESSYNDLKLWSQTIILFAGESNDWGLQDLKASGPSHLALDMSIQLPVPAAMSASHDGLLFF